MARQIIHSGRIKPTSRVTAEDRAHLERLAAVRNTPAKECRALHALDAIKNGNQVSESEH